MLHVDDRADSHLAGLDDRRRGFHDERIVRRAEQFAINDTRQRPQNFRAVFRLKFSVARSPVDPETLDGVSTVLCNAPLSEINHYELLGDLANSGRDGATDRRDLRGAVSGLRTADPVEVRELACRCL